MDFVPVLEVKLLSMTYVMKKASATVPTFDTAPASFFELSSVAQYSVEYDQ